MRCFALGLQSAGKSRMEKFHITNPVIYGHLPFRTIRLLKFHKAPTNDFVGSLEVAKLEEAPPYYTLSYCWGRDPESVPLKLKDGTILINSNLAAAIQRLRKFTTNGAAESVPSQYIWIDKICINQNDTSERSTQVSLMDRIYAKAIRTLVWLGSDIGNCPGGWSLVDSIYEACMEQNPGVESIVDIAFQLYSKELHTTSGLPAFAHKHWKSLSELLKDPWFTRVWVIQEIVLSSEDPIILHGHHQHSWSRLGWAASWMRRNGFFRLPEFPEALRNIDEMSNIRRSRRRWPLDALLATTSVKFHATDQRDKVYALLGIAAETQDPFHKPVQLQPDYSLSVEQVYINTARYLLQSSQSLAVMIRTRHTSSFCGQNQHTHDLSHLPTWVPDWSDFELSDRDITKSLSWVNYSKPSTPVSLDYPRHCTASVGRPIAITNPAEENTLCVNGIMVDMISHCFPFTDPGHSHKDFADKFSSTSLRILECVTTLLAGRSVITWMTDYIRTTTAEQYDLSGHSCELLLKDGAAYILELLSTHDELRAKVNTSSTESNVTSLISDFALDGNPTIYAALARNFCYGRSLVVTSRQRMGLVLANAYVGDFVSVLYGGGVPYVLRGHADGYWEFIGDSYFPDLTRGEAVEFQRRKVLKEETFPIR